MVEYSFLIKFLPSSLLTAAARGWTVGIRMSCRLPLRNNTKRGCCGEHYCLQILLEQITINHEVPTQRSTLGKIVESPSNGNTRILNWTNSPWINLSVWHSTAVSNQRRRSPLVHDFYRRSNPKNHRANHRWLTTVESVAQHGVGREETDIFSGADSSAHIAQISSRAISWSHQLRWYLLCGQWGAMRFVKDCQISKDTCKQCGKTSHSHGYCGCFAKPSAVGKQIAVANKHSKLRLELFNIMTYCLFYCSASRIFWQ